MLRAPWRMWLGTSGKLRVSRFHLTSDRDVENLFGRETGGRTKAPFFGDVLVGKVMIHGIWGPPYSQKPGFYHPQIAWIC